MSRFSENIMETYPFRMDARPLRVKIWHWFEPKFVEEDGNRLVFDARSVASRFGNRAFRAELRADRKAELALLDDLQGTYYKSAVGLLAVGSTIEPVRLETLNTDGELGLIMRQHALIAHRESMDGRIQVQFR